MKEIFEIYPTGVLVPFKSEALKKAHEDFESLYYDLLSEKLEQEDIRKRLESTSTLLHILYEENFIQDKLVDDLSCIPTHK